MKKKILFICSNMEIGGFQKSLVSLLSYFDYDKYDVDLLLFNHNGIFMDLIPSEVNIIPCIMPEEYFYTFDKSIKGLLKKGKLFLACIRIIVAILSKVNKGYAGIIMSKVIPRLEQNYDVAIDYNGQYILYYMIDKIKARKKITYFHSDYEMWSYYKSADKRYYKYVDHIVTVSDLCVESLKKHFPEQKHKIYNIENIISDKTTNLYALNSNNFKDKFDGVRIVTVGRVSNEKGIDLAIEACGILKNKGYKIRWYFIGPKYNMEFYENLMNINDVKDCCYFLGETNNPYDYMRNSDVVVHPSRFEGKAVAIEEAKILKKPIVATCFSTVYNQIDNEQTGIIVSMNSKSIAEGIEKYLIDYKFKEKIIDNLKINCMGNDSEIEKLYKLINE